MNPRERLIDKFSTFIEFRSDVPTRWISDARLRRNMTFEMQRYDESQLSINAESDVFWSQLWHLEWKQQSDNQKKGLARAHLMAYLQETCWWVARDFSRSLRGEVFSPADCFQMAIAEVDKVLIAYDSRRTASLRSYAKLVYRSRLRDIFRQQGEAEISSNWTLLRRVSKSAFLEALALSGESPKVIEHYCLAWSCFKQVVQGNVEQASGDIRRQVSQGLEHFQQQASSISSSTALIGNRASVDWDSIAMLYHARVLETPGETPPDVTPSTLKQWLTYCAQRIRAHLNPSILSLNIPSFETNKGEWQDAIPYVSATSIEILIEAEELSRRHLEHQQINQGLVNAIFRLSKNHQQLLQLFYGDRLIQRQIAEQMGMNQSSISRQLTRTRTTLLDTLIQWCENNLHISSNPALIESMSTHLEEWLDVYYESAQPPPDDT